MVGFNVPQDDTLIFDYDDTLGGVRFPDGSIRPGADAYFDVIERFAAQIERIGLDPARARTLQHDIDLALAKTHGFADKTRFASSLVEAYRTMTEPRENPGMERVMFSIGMSVFTDYPYAPLEGALDVLNITSRHYRIAIVTKGEYHEQMKKLRDTGVGSFADKIYIVGNKNEQDWNEVLADLQITDETTASGSWAIGNSAKADVNPLLSRGFNGIEIAEKNKWAFEAAALEAAMPGRISATVMDITQVLDYLPIQQ